MENTERQIRCDTLRTLIETGRYHVPAPEIAAAIQTDQALDGIARIILSNPEMTLDQADFLYSGIAQSMAGVESHEIHYLSLSEYEAMLRLEDWRERRDRLDAGLDAIDAEPGYAFGSALVGAWFVVSAMLLLGVCGYLFVRGLGLW